MTDRKSGEPTPGDYREDPGRSSDTPADQVPTEEPGETEAHPS